MKFKNLTDYKYTRLYYQQANAEGLLISKPIDVKPLIPVLSQMKALEVEFNRTAFKKEFDSAKFVEELLTSTQLEYLELKRDHRIKRLPDAIGSQPLRYLDITTVDVDDFSNVLPQLEKLEQLQLSFKKAKLGSAIGKLKQLTMLRITADEIIDVEAICELENLEYISLYVKDLSSLPENFKKLKNLKYLEIHDANLQSFSNDLNLPNLQSLKLYNLRELREIPESLLYAQQLADLSLYGLSQQSFSMPATVNLPSLRELSISSVALEQLPELHVPILLKLRLENLPIKKACKQIKDASLIEDITFNGLKLDNEDIDLLPCKKVKTYFGPVFSSTGIMDFKVWPELQHVHLQESYTGSFNILENSALKKVVLSKLSIESMEELPPHVEEITISNCVSLKRICVLKSYHALRYLYIKDNLSLSEVEVKGIVLPSLVVIEVSNCPQVKTLHPGLFLAPELAHLRVSNSGTTIDDQVEPVSDLLEFLKKNNVNLDEKEALAFWLFRNYSTEVPSLHTLRTTLTLLRFPNDMIFNLVIKHLKYFNAEHRSLQDFSQAEIAGKKIGIAGNTFASKAFIKESIMSLDALSTTNITEASFVLVGKKIDGTIPFGEQHILFSEIELNQYIDKHQPKFLKQEHVTSDELNNLRRILWSTDPETELMALEMLKNGGLPDEVIGECIAIAKTSIDKGVKDKYKKFLKGKVSEDVFRLVSKNVRFDLSDPFYKLLREFPTPLLGRLAMAHYQRTRNFWETVLNLHLEDFDLRKQIIEAHVVPLALEKPHYLSLRFKLTTDELRDILLLPEVAGKLKRLHINTGDDNLPEELGNHTSLKELEIQGNLTSKSIPVVIFKLKRVSELKISSDTIEEVDEQIGQLKELKSLIIYNKKLLRLPESLRELPKLKRAYFSQGVENGAQWSDFLKKH